MLAKVPPKRGDGGSSFRSLGRYIGEERDHVDPGTGEVTRRGVSVETNCLSPETAWAEMWGVAGQNAEVKDPVYHVVLTWQPGEVPTDEQAFEAARKAMESVGLDGHQYVAAVHRDTDHHHVHLMVNRVHPETYKVWDRYRDYYKFDRAMREIELEQGWGRTNGVYAVHKVNGEMVVDWAKPSARAWREDRAAKSAAKLPAKARQMEAMTGNESLAAYVQGEPRRFILQVLKAPGTDWMKLHAALQSCGLEIKPKGQGFALYSATDPKQTPVKASAMAQELGAGKLVKLLGPFQARPPVMAEIAPALDYSTRRPRRDPLVRDAQRITRGKERQALRDRYDAHLAIWKNTKAPAKAELQEKHMAEMADLKARHQVERERIANGESPSDLLAAMNAVTAAVLERVTEMDAVFTMRDLQKELEAFLEQQGKQEDYEDALAAITGSSALVLMHPGGAGEQARYSTKDMVQMERNLVDLAERLHLKSEHGISPGVIEGVLKQFPQLAQEQREAIQHVTGMGHVACVVGDPGTGKTFSVASAKAIWEKAGFRVMGAAPSAKAADGLANDAKIPSYTLASWAMAWKNGQRKLTKRDVLVVDEAGMIETRAMKRLMDEISATGAKVVFLGDQKQLPPIGAGAPFRALVERLGAAELMEIRRQKQEWAREASKQFARGSVETAMKAYQERGAITFTDTIEEARNRLAQRWIEDRQATQGKGSRIILAFRNADVAYLNETIREARKSQGELVNAQPFKAETGQLDFAIGDRIVFTDNNRRLAVQNGALGTVERAEAGKLSVRLDNGQLRQFSDTEYPYVSHGYAVTIHKAQGVTMDKAWKLLTPDLDRALSLVGMTRHRESVECFACRDDFLPKKLRGKEADKLSAEQRDTLAFEGLVKTMARVTPKESTLDFANRRGFDGEKVVRYQLDQGKAFLNAMEVHADPAKGRTLGDKAVAKSVLAMVQAHERQALESRFKAERQSFRAEKPQSFREWVADRAQEGDRAAISQLRGWAYADKRMATQLRREEKLAEQSPNYGTDSREPMDPAKPRVTERISFEVDRNTGTVAYSMDGKPAFKDYGNRIGMAQQQGIYDHDVIEAALRLAVEKFGPEGKVKVTGDNKQFAEETLSVAVYRGVDVQFSDPELEARRLQWVAELREVERAAPDQQQVGEQAPEHDLAATDNPAPELATPRPSLPRMSAFERKAAMEAPAPTLDRDAIVAAAIDQRVLEIHTDRNHTFFDTHGERPEEKQGWLGRRASQREGEAWDVAKREFDAETRQIIDEHTEFLRSDDPKAEQWRAGVLAPAERKYEERYIAWSSKRAQAVQEVAELQAAERQSRRERFMGNESKRQQQEVDKQVARDNPDLNKDSGPDLDF